jgi:hypothetical protein
LFFAPKGTWNVKFVLKVDENATSSEAAEKLGRRWATFYEKQACTHMGLSRYGNVIIGSSAEPFSLGDGVGVQGRIPRRMLGPKLHNNGREFKQFEKVEELCRWLRPFAVDGSISAGLRLS